MMGYLIIVLKLASVEAKRGPQIQGASPSASEAQVNIFDEMVFDGENEEEKSIEYSALYDTQIYKQYSDFQHGNGGGCEMLLNIENNNNNPTKTKSSVS